MAAAKAELLDLVVVSPGHEGKLEPNMPANRAEVAALLYKMMQEAKLNPNAKLAEAMNVTLSDKELQLIENEAKKTEIRQQGKWEPQ